MGRREKDKELARKRKRRERRLRRKAEKEAGTKVKEGTKKDKKLKKKDTKEKKGNKEKLGENEGYCVKCKSKRTMVKAKVGKLKSGMNAAKGECSECGTRMCKILGKG